MAADGPSGVIRQHGKAQLLHRIGISGRGQAVGGHRAAFGVRLGICRQARSVRALRGIVVHGGAQPVKMPVVGDAHRSEQYADQHQSDAGPAQAIVLRAAAHLHIVETDFHS